MKPPRPFKRFETLNQEKIGFPLAHTYGDEGHYSLVQDALTVNPQVGPMIPVTFTAQSIDHGPRAAAEQGDRPQGGACLVTPAGEQAYLLVMASGDGCDPRLRASPGWQLRPGAQRADGPGGSGTGVACTVGDFDNDGLPDVAVAMSDRVLLFKNHGGGKFTDVTAATGVQPANQPCRHHLCRLRP